MKLLVCIQNNEWWWIKTDLVSGLRTSVWWSGDVDRLLQEAYESHKKRIDFLSDLGGTGMVNLAEIVVKAKLSKTSILCVLVSC